MEIAFDGDDELHIQLLLADVDLIRHLESILQVKRKIHRQPLNEPQ